TRTFLPPSFVCIYFQPISSARDLRLRSNPVLLLISLRNWEVTSTHIILSRRRMEVIAFAPRTSAIISSYERVLVRCLSPWLSIIESLGPGGSLFILLL